MQITWLPHGLNELDHTDHTDHTDQDLADLDHDVRVDDLFLVLILWVCLRRFGLG